MEKNLETESSFFKFLFRQFATGDVVVPSKGMQAIPEQIAAHLAPHQIRLNTPVERIEGNTIFLKNGESLLAEKIVIATDANTAARLLGKKAETRFNATDCLYFECSTPLFKKGPSYLTVNANADECIDHLIVLSDTAPSYAPDGRTLVSVSTVGNHGLSEAELLEKVQGELRVWFGPKHTWKHLRTYRIPEALPQYFQDSPHYSTLQINDFTFCCGDYMAYPSLNAAMRTGREVAELLIG